MARNLSTLVLITVAISAFVLAGKKDPDYEDNPQDEIIELTEKQLKEAVEYNCIPNGVKCGGGALRLTPRQRCCGQCSFRSGKCRSYKPGLPSYPIFPIIPAFPPYY
ncbi:unnamed protein product [Allacma fusca]|uniref:Uncharacterized protein n=1 Tax=Allacma fusca TaxID=39272 RepID=A0A8J2Q6N4_9HEXA|nr:unnamed protein product [Allacma fusca]